MLGRRESAGPPNHRPLALVGLAVALCCMAPGALASQSLPGNCAETKPRSNGIVRECNAAAVKQKKEAPCARFDPSKPETLKSNRCLAEFNNRDVRDATGQAIDYSLFGRNDCRTGQRRMIGSITTVVVHNGGRSAPANARSWECSQVAAHYTIQRDGRIFQHIGEELISWHALGVNAKSIGIELNHAGPPGRSCNQLKNGSPLFKGLTPEQRTEQVVKACGPTKEQYTSLQTLVKAISARTAASIDEDHVIGHCETGRGHLDPRAFDWSAIGLSNKIKRERLKKQRTSCDDYHFAPGASD